MKVAIVGLGLIGGSLGLNFMKNKFISTVIGHDASAAAERCAIERGIVHECAPLAELGGCDLICLCTPVDATVRLLSQLPPLAEHTSIAEFGSTKGAIAAALTPELAARTILAHPMAGTEHSGPQAAFAELFAGAVCVLCDAQRAEVAHQHKIIELLGTLGMRLAFMSTAEHDHHSAIISHLPHVISFALANYVLGCEKPENIVHMAGGSFADMSRIAKSNPAMWQGIFEQNAQNVSAALKGFASELNKFAAMLNEGDEQQLREWMREANRLKDIL